MNHALLEELEQNSRYLNAILRQEFGWRIKNFVDGRAPIASRRGMQVWKPKTTFAEKVLFGEQRRLTVNAVDIINRGTFLKFAPPRADDLTKISLVELADFHAWRKHFVQEPSWDSAIQDCVVLGSSKPDLFNRWVEVKQQNFVSPSRGHFEIYFVDIDVMDVRARLPSIVLSGAEWIQVSPPLQ